MKAILKEEVGRALRSSGMIMSLLLGGTIAAAQVIQYQVTMYRWNLSGALADFPIQYPYLAASSWLGGGAGFMESFLYFLVIPILAVLPFGTSYFSDRTSGFLKGLYMRISRKEYLMAKYMAVFLSGGLAVILPLAANLLCALELLPNLIPQSVLAFNRISGENLFYKIYFSHPIVYTVIFLCLDFVMGGIWACVALVCSFLSEYKFVIAVCPFFLQLGIHVICTMLPVKPDRSGLDYSSVYFTQSGYGIKSAVVPAVYVILGIALTWGIFRKVGEKEDVF